MHVMWNRGKRKSPLFQILALLASRRRSDRPCRVLRALLQFICFLWFYILFFHYNLILRTAQSLQSFFRHSLFASHYLYLLLRPFQSFYFSVHDHLVVSNQIVGCIPGLHSGWHFRGYLLKHDFALHKLFWLCRQCPAAAVLQTCLYRISAGWKTNRCRGGFLLHSVSFVNLFTEQTKKHLLILRS